MVENSYINLCKWWNFWPQIQGINHQKAFWPILVAKRDREFDTFVSSCLQFLVRDLTQKWGVHWDMQCMHLILTKSFTSTTAILVRSKWWWGTVHFDHQRWFYILRMAQSSGFSLSITNRKLNYWIVFHPLALLTSGFPTKGAIFWSKGLKRGTNGWKTRTTLPFFTRHGQTTRSRASVANSNDRQKLYWMNFNFPLPWLNPLCGLFRVLWTTPGSKDSRISVHSRSLQHMSRIRLL